MEELIAYRSDMLSALGSVLEELSKAASKLPVHTWALPISPDGHTPHYVLYHLYALESQVFNVQLPRIRTEEILELPNFDDDAWLAAHYNAEEPAMNIIDEIIKLRQQELGWLRNLSSQEWSCTARHPWWGVHTMQWWVELQLEYSLQVLKQLTTWAKSEIRNDV